MNDEIVILFWSTDKDNTMMFLAYNDDIGYHGTRDIAKALTFNYDKEDENLTKQVVSDVVTLLYNYIATEEESVISHLKEVIEEDLDIFTGQGSSFFIVNYENSGLLIDRFM